MTIIHPLFISSRLDHPACSSSSSNADSSGTLQTRRKLRLKAIQLNRDDCCCSLSSSPSPPSPKRPIVTKQGRLYCCLCCGGWSKFGSLSPSKWNHRSPSSNHSRTPGSTFVFHRQTLRTTITASVDEPLEFDEHGTGVDFKYPEDHVRLLDHNESRRIHCGSMDCKHSQEEHDDDYEGKEDMGTDNFARGGSHSTRNRLATRPLKCLKSDPNKECPDLGQQCNRQDITITVSTANYWSGCFTYLGNESLNLDQIKLGKETRACIHCSGNFFVFMGCSLATKLLESKVR